MTPRQTYPIDGLTALGDGISNPYAGWTSGRSPRDPAAAPTDAAARVFDSYSDIQATCDGPRLRREDGIYAIGSCFAREVEHHLDAEGANVLSLARETVEDAPFRDEAGRTVLGYFHRYTPQSMAQDIARGFGALDGWDDEETLIFRSGDKVLDFDLGWIGKGDTDIAMVRSRRAAMRRLSQGLRTARCVIVTLGLTETWRHRSDRLLVQQGLARGPAPQRRRLRIHRHPL
ncbi:MAG: GSCFA domain-containing protein [Brevundimonas sp.]